MSKEKRAKSKVVKAIIRYGILLLIILGLVFIVQYRIRTTEKITYVAPRPTVIIEKPYIGTIEKDATFPTYIEASDTIAVIPFVQGTITSYDIKVGDYVYKDQVLATIDSTLLDQQLIQAQAAYDAYKSTFDRVEALYKKKATTAQNFDEVKAALDAAEAQLELAQIQKDYAKVKAPVSGTVLMAPQAKGNVAAAPNPIAVIANLNSQIVNIKVPEKYYDVFIENKDDISISLSRPQSQATTTATLISIDPYIQAESKVFIVKAKLDGNLNFFRPGMYALATITYERIEDVYVLSQMAKKLDGGVYYYDERDKKAYFLPSEYIISTDENNNIFRVPEEYIDYNFIVQGQNTVFDSQEVNVIKGN